MDEFPKDIDAIAERLGVYKGDARTLWCAEVERHSLDMQQQAAAVGFMAVYVSLSPNKVAYTDLLNEVIEMVTSEGYYRLIREV